MRAISRLRFLTLNRGSPLARVQPVRWTSFQLSRSLSTTPGRFAVDDSDDELLPPEDPSPVTVAPEEPEDPMQNLRPTQLVAELDKHIIGQKDAKRALSIAIRILWY